MSSMEDFFLSTRNVPPEILWHYTSSSALLNIVREGALRFTDYRFLNDSAEFMFGTEVFLREFRSLIATERLDQRRLLLETLAREFEQGRQGMRAYIFCLSDGPDSVSHWTGYANNREPVAAGFYSTSLQINIWEKYGATLVQVIYDHLQQSRLARNAIELFLAEPQCRSFVESKSPNIDTMSFDVFILNCWDLCVRFKNASYSHEREWRLVTRFAFEHGPFNSEMGFQSTGSGIRQHLNMAASNKLLPIAGITIGPMAYGDLQIEAYKEFLTKHEYFGVQVTFTNSTLRF